MTTFGQEQITLKKLDLTKLPKGIKYEGKIKTAVRWVDSLGDNIVILTETGIYKSKKFNHENDGRDAELFAYHFIIKDDNAFQIWRIYDFISDCPVDIETKFIKNSFQVTDLNLDGVSEIWIMYKTVCHGDVSPCDMKIIMYQGQQKYAIRGQNKVQLSENEFYGGEYKFDKAFANGPKEFLEFAKKLWNKNILQIWGE
ncbi:M949_RS01915 family surface polysaccharide biosynthesis protein [Flavobacterium oreochromis]|nr:hypothetical protein [Flavobacterium oreochromis]